MQLCHVEWWRKTHVSLSLGDECVLHVDQLSLISCLCAFSDYNIFINNVDFAKCLNEWASMSTVWSLSLLCDVIMLLFSTYFMCVWEQFPDIVSSVAHDSNPFPFLYPIFSSLCTKCTKWMHIEKVVSVYLSVYTFDVHKYWGDFYQI
jgi:hypothetical protein